jgi:hypothetical protein
MSGRPWTPAEDALLGTAPDANLVAALKRTRPAISKRRSVLGIPPFVRRWTAEEDALLAALADAEVAQRTGRTLAAVKFRRSRTCDRHAK